MVCLAALESNEGRMAFAHMAMFGTRCRIGEEAARAGGTLLADLDMTRGNIEPT